MNKKAIGADNTIETTEKGINMKKLIRLTEEDLHRIVKESVERILSEEMNELGPDIKIGSSSLANNILNKASKILFNLFNIR